MDDEVTFTDFQAALKDIKNDAAPVPSGLTANMVKSWFAANEHMNNLWLKRVTPLWMKDKVIRLAPKVPGSFDLKHMWPISLYKTVRKI
jgi:hypothetical protein